MGDLDTLRMAVHPIHYGNGSAGLGHYLGKQHSLERQAMEAGCIASLWHSLRFPNFKKTKESEADFVEHTVIC